MALTPRHERAARYLALGMSQARTGIMLGVSDRTIRVWISSEPGFAELVAQIRESGAEEIPEDVLHDLLYDPDPRIRLGAAKELVRAAEGKTDVDDELVFED